MKNFYFKSLLIIFLIWLDASRSFSQIIGASAYMIGDNIEIGINSAGHEGAPRLIGSNNRSNQALGSPVYFGFVANPQLDGWGNYDGDFFTPGTPENGFGIEVAGVNYSNNATGATEQIPGSITSYNTEGDCITVVWDGEVANVHVKVVYRLITTELYYTTEVTLTNLGAAPMTDVYYYRNVDPDNNVTIGGGYSTLNTIVSQPTGDCEIALVTAEQTSPWDSYMGFGAIGPNFRVCRGGFINRDGSSIWNGVGGLSGVEGSSAFADKAISLGYRAETLDPGVPETFLYTVVLDASQVDAAIVSLFYFSYDGGGGIIDECSPVVDTAMICQGEMVELTIEGPAVGEYEWEWTPSIGLSTTSGPDTEASPDVTTTYTVTGTPIDGCFAFTIEKIVVIEVADSPIISYVDPEALCGEFDLTTLDVVNLEGSPFEIEYYSLIPDSVGQIVGLWPSDFISIGDVVYMLMYNPETGCYDVALVIIDFIAEADAGEDNSGVVCNSEGSIIDLNELLIGADLEGLWTEISDVFSGGFTPITGVLDASDVDPGEYVFKYIVSGIDPCIDDSTLITITVYEEALAGLDGFASTCYSIDGTTIDLNTLLDGNNDIGTWMETTESGQFDPVTGIFDGSGLAAGTYTFIYTVTAFAPCAPDVADFTITILPIPSIDAGDDFAVCVGDPIVLYGSGAGIGGVYIWDGGIVDGEVFTPLATTTYICTGIDENGCTNTDEITVDILELPEIYAGIDFSVCDGETAMVEGSGAGVDGTYTWSGGVTDGNPFIPEATTTYTVVGVDDNGCEGTDDVLVTVTPLPTIFAGPDQEICEGELVTVTASGAGDEGTYVWEGEVVDGTPFELDASSEFTVIGTTAAGCSNSDIMWVEVNPLPEINFTVDEVMGCAPLTVNFFSLFDAEEYAWIFGDGTSGIGGAPTHTFDYSGTFDITLTATSTEGCSATETYSGYIDVAEAPVANYIYSPDVITINDTRVEFINESVNANSYVWNFGDGSPEVFTENAEHEFPTLGDIKYVAKLTATNDHGCVDEVKKVIAIEDQLIYYVPNTFTPDGDSYNNSFTPIFEAGLDIYDFHIMIINRWGELIFESYDVEYGWSGSYKDGVLAESGVYIYKIEFGETMSDKRHFVEGHVTLLK